MLGKWINFSTMVDGTLAIRDQCFAGYLWPARVRRELAANNFWHERDEDKLRWLATRLKSRTHVVVSMVSKEYLSLALIWIRYLRRSGIEDFFLIAADKDSADFLSLINIPFVEVHLRPAILAQKGYRNAGGFDAKGAAIIFARTQIIQWLIRRNINVIHCDLDAVLLKNPTSYLSKEADISFQRVKYHPDKIAEMWGFTCCGGFAAFKSTRNVEEFLFEVREIQSHISSDQIAFNVALLERKANWDIDFPGAREPGQHKQWFVETAGTRFLGQLQGPTLIVEALAANQFWRHKFVGIDRRNAVLLHPNSIKEEQDKIRAVNLALARLDHITESGIT